MLNSEVLQLRERRAQLVNENTDTLAKIETWTDIANLAGRKALEGEWDKRDAEIVALDKQIHRLERQDEAERNLNEPLRQRRSGRGAGSDEAELDAKAPVLFRNAESGAVLRGVLGEHRLAVAYPQIARRANGRIGDLIGSIVRGRAITPELEDEFRTMSTTGGYAIPEPYSMQFIDLARAESVLMKAGVVTLPMEGATLKLARITGDPTASWKSENSAFGASDVSLDAVTLTARTLGILIKMSEELAMDSPNIGKIIETAITSQMGLKLDSAGLIGSGVAPEPGGIMKSGITPNTDVQTQVWGGTPTDYSGFSRMVQRVRTANHVPNAAIWHPRDLGTLERLVDTTGQPKLPPNSWKDVTHLSSTAIAANIESGASPADSSIAIVGKFNEMVFAPRMEIRINASRVSNDGTDSAMDKFQIHIQAVMRADYAIFRGAAFCVGTGLND